jgi:SMODS and SLOG-associating 2TM effector domain family 5
MQNQRFGTESHAEGNGSAPHSSYYVSELQAVRAKYLGDWRTVKGVRFNAAKRFERKHTASLLAFAVAGTVGFVVPFFTLLFTDSLTAHTKNVLDFASYVSGALSLSIGLVEQAKNYPALAARFHVCGLKVNSVLRKLRNSPAPDERVLNALVQEYEHALHECGTNHDEIDRSIAQANQALEDARHPKTAKPGSAMKAIQRAERKLWVLKWKEIVQIYWLYWCVWLGPSALALIVWFALAPTPQ